MKVTGHIVPTRDDCFVFLGTSTVEPDVRYVSFANGQEEVRLRLSCEALDALMALFTGNTQGAVLMEDDDGWQIIYRKAIQ